MSAAILGLPTAAPALVEQQRRRGPLPKAVRNLSTYRLKRMREQQELAAANIESVKSLCADLLKRAMQGEVKGLVVIASEGGEVWAARAVGDYEGKDNQKRLVRSARWLAEVVTHDPAAERSS